MVRNDKAYPYPVADLENFSLREEGGGGISKKYMKFENFKGDF